MLGLPIEVPDVKNAITPLLPILLLAVAGCRRDAATSADGSSHARKFAVTYQTIDNPFFRDLHDGLLAEITARGDSLELYDASFDAQTQANQIGDMISAGYAGIFLNPVNWKGVGRSLQKAKGAGIPVVVIDAPVEDESLVLATVASDNFRAGELAGGALVEKRPAGARIIALTLSVNKACRDRMAGFKKAIEARSGFEIVAEQDLKAGRADAAYPVMKDLLVRWPKIDAVFAINDPAAFGALRALDQAGRVDRVDVVAVDGSRKAIEEIRAGRLLGSSAQFPFEIGQAAARAIYDHFEAKPVPHEVKIRVLYVDRENTEEFERQLERARRGETGANAG